MLVGAGLVLHAVDRLIPSPVPFARLGLANVVTLVALIALGLPEALVVTGLRVVVAALILGTFGGPAFLLALAGGLASALVMGALVRWTMPPLGVVGASLVGAAVHNVTQLAVVGALFTGLAAAARLTPAALLVSAAAGLATGIVAWLVLNRLPLAGEAAARRDSKLRRERA
ncbi:MAG: heptaprenyl diphosphate synthase [Candidatus Eisenbacteria bacterium]|nr:heptaprenyl diphosphate synthase [Candidatus Eisenbacteria bacterium]